MNLQWEGLDVSGPLAVVHGSIAMFFPCRRFTERSSRGSSRDVVVAFEPVS